MTYWTLIKQYGAYYWRGDSCWGGSAQLDGGYTTRAAALLRTPFGAGDDWHDATGDPADAPRTASWDDE